MTEEKREALEELEQAFRTLGHYAYRSADAFASEVVRKAITRLRSELSTLRQQLEAERHWTQVVWDEGYDRALEHLSDPHAETERADNPYRVSAEAPALPVGSATP